ncbi:MAG: HAMP domain-containing histidine kinase, partial [Campylobacterales bacterium]|nr:HAMP domain-containing histidine kinase [Campylobacterales bacterium]
LHDITEQTLLQEEKEKQEKLLVQQSKMASMGEMIAAIAHQWKQPLNVLFLMSQDFEELDELGELDDDYKKTFIKKMQKQLEFMNDTIEDFRNFFRPSKEKIAFDVVMGIKNILHLLKTQFKSNSISVNLTIQENSNTMTFGYPNEFKQVVLNLVNNAKDAYIGLRESGLLSKSEISNIDINIENINNFIYVHVQDYAGGIKQQVLDKLFEPYNSTKGEKGTGIGLTIAKTIIENMDGEISGKNENGGAKFTIKLKISET